MVARAGVTCRPGPTRREPLGTRLAPDGTRGLSRGRTLTSLAAALALPARQTKPSPIIASAPRCAAVVCSESSRLCARNAAGSVPEGAPSTRPSETGGLLPGTASEALARPGGAMAFPLPAEISRTVQVTGGRACPSPWVSCSRVLRAARRRGLQAARGNGHAGLAERLPGRSLPDRVMTSASASCGSPKCNGE